MSAATGKAVITIESDGEFTRGTVAFESPHGDEPQQNVVAHQIAYIVMQKMALEFSGNEEDAVRH